MFLVKTFCGIFSAMMNDLEFLDSVKVMPLMKLPVRSTIVNLNDAKILLSPGSALTKAQYQNIRGVTDIVATSLLHWAGVPLALSIFPNARVWGHSKVQAAHEGVIWTHELNENTWSHQAELPTIEIKGIPKVGEFVFYHKKSKTLIVSDFAFNMTSVRGIGPLIILNLFGTYRRFAVSKFFLKFMEDRNAFEASLGEVFSYDFENLVVSHGDPVMGSAKDKLAAAFRERGFGI
ncbi:MAG: hypothetical protein A4S09_02605 [Proteobacteria bacterium SG_bin7]|nr:MAG: hypothetical protein A4S09_02605 [Proteobacteria bacterium SG_bin7]